MPNMATHFFSHFKGTSIRFNKHHDARHSHSGGAAHDTRFGDDTPHVPRDAAAHPSRGRSGNGREDCPNSGGENVAPVTSAVTLATIAEDSAARLITQAELLANASDVDSTSLSATNLAISAGGGTLVDNGDGSWTYTPALNDDTSVSFSYSVSDGTASVAGSATLDITPVNDAPVTSAGDACGDRRRQRRAPDHPGRTAGQRQRRGQHQPERHGLAISAGSGTLVDNGDGTWTYTPALNDDTSVSFSYTVTRRHGLGGGHARRWTSRRSTTRR